MDPRISLAIDNCFASKRWTRPEDWIPLIKKLGLSLIEASADTETDPLYMGEAYLSDWIDEVRRLSDKYQARVVNLYSGHGTYSTLGLTHTDERVRSRFLDEWVKAHARTASELGAGLGFFAHAINEPALHNPEEYAVYKNALCDSLVELAQYAEEVGLSSVGVEQMYSPHQPPWKVGEAKDLLRDIYQKAKAPFYLTIDLGHMNGQQYFQRPSEETIRTWIEKKKAGKPCKRIWLGPNRAKAIFAEAVAGKMSIPDAVRQIRASWEGFDYLFAKPEDGSVHHWVRELAQYSPIIHLQQSDGKSSPHWPFSKDFNERGIIHAEEIIADIKAAYAQEPQDGMPPVCDHIMLTLEPFIGTSGNVDDALEEIGESIAYWRQFVPRDGILLSQI